MALLITLAFIALILLCGFMVLVILMQKASQGAGLGGAVAGGAAESAFGGEASNVLTKITIYCAIIFFLGCFGLSLIILHRHSNPEQFGLSKELQQIIDAEDGASQTEGPSDVEATTQAVEEKVEAAVETVKETAAEAKEQTEAAVEKATEKVEDAAQKAKEAVTEQAPAVPSTPEVNAEGLAVPGK